MAVNNKNVRYELVAEPGVEHAPEPPLRLLRRTLRGRYGLVLILVASLAVCGAITGYRAASPVYESTGLVRIEGAIPSILFESRENQVPPMFDAFVSSQVTYLQSRDVLDAAASMPQMTEAGWPGGKEGVARLQNALTVRRGRGEQLISVTASHSDPQLAQTAVDAVLAAYVQNTSETNSISPATKLETLVQREAHLQQRLHDLRQQILDASDQYGLDAIDRIHRSKVEELVAIDRKLVELQLARSAIEMGGDELPVAGQPSLRDSDPTQTRLEEQELALRAELASLQTKYRENSPIIRELKRQIEALRIQRELRQQSGVAETSLAGSGSAYGLDSAPTTPRDQLIGLERQYLAMRDRVREEAAALGQKKIVLTGLNEQVAVERDRLAETQRRLDELRVEAGNLDVDRITIAAHADLPVIPVSDRRQGLAAAGALFGAVLGVGIVFFIGYVDPRIRYADDLAALNLPAPVVGLLPDVNLAGEQSESLAARSVHQLRNLLELRYRDPQDNVQTITSCDRGEGKTSLALALAASYAAAGRRTLVIDADVARRSLTRELGLSEAPGLCEAIGPDNSNAQVHQTRHENLWALPIGSAEGLDPEDLSRDRLVWLIEALRSRFDAVIFDTGPILTSVEASLVSAVSDRTLVMVGRNQKSELVRTSVERLEQVGVASLGMVLNRAATSDFRKREASVKSASTRIARLLPSGAYATAATDTPNGRTRGADIDQPFSRKRAA